MPRSLSIEERRQLMKAYVANVLPAADGFGAAVAKAEG